MKEILFPSLPTFRKINMNTLKFEPKEGEDISALQTAKKSDELIIGQSRFILHSAPSIQWSRVIGRRLPDSPPPRIIEVIVFGKYKPQGKAMFKVYTKPNCPFCVQAKELLDSHGIAFEEYILDVGQEKEGSKAYFTVPQLQSLIPGVRTVPQIFNDTVLIGGAEALKKYLETNK